MLGSAQLAWLKNRLSASTASFKLLILGSRWTFNGSSDSWNSYKTERNDLLQYIKTQAIPGVILVSGDIHRSVVTVLTNDTTGAWMPQTGSLATPALYPLYEFTSSGISATGSNCSSTPSVNEQLFCVENTHQYAIASFDMTAADPSVTFDFYIDGTATPVQSHTVTLQELTP
jgi:alkaline phosphatase D